MRNFKPHLFRASGYQQPLIEVIYTSREILFSESVCPSDKFKSFIVLLLLKFKNNYGIKY